LLAWLLAGQDPDEVLVRTEGIRIRALSWGKLDLGLVGSETLLLPTHLYLGAVGASSVAEKRSNGDFVMVDICCPTLGTGGGGGGGEPTTKELRTGVLRGSDGTRAGRHGTRLMSAYKRVRLK
jgi:hypothetical protein